LSPASASDPTEVIGAEGGSVTFHGHDADGSSAFWRLGTESIVAVEFEDPPRPVFSKRKFQTRFKVSANGRALSISQLRLEDAGTYSVEIGEETSTFTLQVYRELAELTVTCEAQNCSGGSCRFSLRCSAPGAGLGNVSYAWSVGDRPWHEGSALLWAGEAARDEPEPLACRARNPVSSRNVTVSTPGALCAGEGREGRAGKGGELLLLS
ncbi:SLAF7 protein, partial [Regulus satrapa]|nr:SLAF7 protein [Regulus satrapa]